MEETNVEAAGQTETRCFGDSLEGAAADHKQELCCLEDGRQSNTLKAVFNPNDQLQISVVPAHVQQMVLIKEEASEEWRPGVDQLDPEPLNIKEEEETDVSRFSVSAVPVKSEDDEEKPLFSQLHQHQVEDRDLPTSSSADQMEAAADEEDCGGAGSTRKPDDCSSSETELSEDYEDDEDEKNPDCQLKNLSDSGPKPEDGKKEWKESRAVNTVSKCLSCSECGKQYVNNRSLQRHMTCHPGVRSSSCLGNKKSVRVKKTVESHRTVQTEPKSFRCLDCNKIFNKKANLNRHLRVHTGDKPVECDDCGERFSYKTTLNRHMRIHTGDKPFPCDVCGQRFSQKSTLNSHIRIHTGEKPFPCDVCELRFSRKHHLKRHTRIHTGDKKFSCKTLNGSCVPTRGHSELNVCSSKVCCQIVCVERKFVLSYQSS
ncbi:zinc finger protein OZF-like isoform X4 [Kryptolebias marmoratus]|uniref:zinc finger protein OZF-like isoform X3 n=1 Tax=Kryptolebias marmoratus TaxID=37003 RepID=UPI0018ACA7B1|nr:zinc finger protein OZF-like isoform X3 [Kryptolebias marmoratus]XP_037834303.1 zinc finger protein OZF-like isoform X4 [Kryptolebias marmoratus]